MIYIQAIHFYKGGLRSEIGTIGEVISRTGVPPSYYHVRRSYVRRNGASRDVLLHEARSLTEAVTHYEIHLQNDKD
jgi:hypothetical protein